MIVKDEAHVLERCLGALKPHIDCAVIIDTGSTDSTIELIPTLLNDVTIEHSPFVSFRHNRTELLERARFLYPKADFHLMMDADDSWVPEEGFAWPDLTEDSYEFIHRLGSLAWWRPQLFRASKPFRYEGVAHEAVTCDEPFTRGKIEGVRVQCGTDGARRKKEPLKKYERVAGILEEDYEKNPDNRRTVFYLAQSYRDSLKNEKALEFYEKRAEMGGWAEEVWYSKYQIGMLRATLGYSAEETLNAHLDAFLYRPTRSESLVMAANLCRRTKQHGLALLHAATAIHIPYPEKDRLFVDWWVYQWRAWDEFAMACWNLGRMNDAIWANFQILKQPADGGYPVNRLIDNIAHCSRPKEKFDDLRSMWATVHSSKMKDKVKLTDTLLQITDDLGEFHEQIMKAIQREV